MARIPRPWFRKQTRCWYVTIDGVQHNLGKNKKQAEQFFHKLMLERPKTIRRDSIYAIIEAFLDWTQRNRAPDTYEWYRQRLQAFADHVGDLSCDEVRVHHVQSFLDGYDHLASGTRRNYCRAVKRCFRWAEQQGYIERSPVQHMEQPSGGRREQIITLEDHKKILALASDQEFRNLLTVHWETGCRAQESLRVTGEHVDLKRRRWFFSKGKGGRPRAVYLTDTAMEITERLSTRYTDGALFRNTDGMAWTPDAVNCRFARMQKHIGVKYCLTAYRHSFATRMLESGVDSMTVAALMSH
ncbi:MAG: tyrosine-type recombinase/integrase [Planctomycetaceae bacterium]|nr:tyrosine-type recombinase/integrase [Planctomycetaceae bacterium]